MVAIEALSAPALGPESMHQRFTRNLRKAAAWGVIPLSGIKEEKPQLPFFGKEAQEKIASAFADLLRSNAGYLLAPGIGAGAGALAGGLRARFSQKKKDPREVLNQALKGALIGGGIGLAGKALVSGAGNLGMGAGVVDDPSIPPSEQPKGTLWDEIVSATVGGGLGHAWGRRGGSAAAITAGTGTNPVLKSKNIEGGRTEVRFANPGATGRNSTFTFEQGKPHQAVNEMRASVANDASRNPSWLDRLTGKADLQALDSRLGSSIDNMGAESKAKTIAKELADRVARSKNPATVKSITDFQTSTKGMSGDKLLEALRGSKDPALRAIVKQLGDSRALSTLAPAEQMKLVSGLGGTRASLMHAIETGKAKGLGAGLRVAPVRRVGGTAGGMLLGALLPTILERAVGSETAEDSAREAAKDIFR